MEKLTNYEKETIINFNDDEDTASIYTCNKAWISKMDKLVASDSRVTVETKDEHSKTYIIPKKAVKVRMSRPLSGSELKKRQLQVKRNFGKL